MAYVVCQTPKCQQTYPMEQFNRDSRNVSCEKCGGVVIDKDGGVRLSQNAAVIPVVIPKKSEE